jgi:RHH-type proline utilization regulon transcriptional repressor/proline dehydrogenase/delta 1-pyrroline-5-carboxylate dehydrogenase
VQALGGTTLNASAMVDLAALETLPDISGVIWWGDAATARDIELALSRREGAIIALLSGLPEITQVMEETHVCVDTTASGGNADLLGGMT